MCWNFEVSLFTSLLSTAISILIITVARTNQHKFYGAATIGICSMQWAETFLWHNGDLVESCREGGANRFGTQVLVRVALLLQPLGSYFGAWQWMLGATLRKWSLLYAIPPCALQMLAPMRYFLIGDAYGCEDVSIKILCKHLCTRLTRSGYLMWDMGAPTALWELLAWFIYIGIVPLIVARPFRKALFICAYGLLCLMASWFFTDSPGSHWCLYVTGYALLGLLDIYASSHGKDAE